MPDVVLGGTNPLHDALVMELVPAWQINGTTPIRRPIVQRPEADEA